MERRENVDDRQKGRRVKMEKRERRERRDKMEKREWRGEIVKERHTGEDR